MVSFEERLEELAKRTERQALVVFNTMRAAGHELMPQFIIVDQQWNLSAIGGTFRTDDDKDMIAKQIRQLARKSKAVAVCFLSEAWCLETPNVHGVQEVGVGGRVIDGELVRPTESPNRFEALVLQIDTVLWSRSIMWEIKPGLSSLKPQLVNRTQHDESQGRFTHLCERFHS